LGSAARHATGLVEYPPPHPLHTVAATANGSTPSADSTSTLQAPRLGTRMAFAYAR
jgi:hypothetical protein